MSNSTNLALPYLTLGQAQKHVTVNESLLRLDALVQLSAVSATTSAEPGSPNDGEVYILPAGKTGAHWGAMTNLALAYYRDGVWEEIQPREGWFAFVKDTDKGYYHDGSAWIATPLKMTATDKVLGRSSAGAGAIEEIAFTAAARALCDDASASAMLTTLGAAGAAVANTFSESQTISKNQNATTAVTVQNTGAGAGATAALTLTSNAGSASFALGSNNNAFGAGFGSISYPAKLALVAIDDITAVRNGTTLLTLGANTLDCGAPIKRKSYTVATLPAAVTVGAGAGAYVTDSNTTTFNATVAGGGANKISVTSDGTNWKVS